MRTKYVGKITDEKEKQQIWELLCECDQEFWPPLSARNSSVQKDLRSGAVEEEQTGDTVQKPTVYFDEMISQEFILACDEEGKVAGFMTFKKDYTCDALKDFGTSLYITTICVKKNLRRQHIMSGLYDCMETTAAAACGCSRISTRTWSENEAHMKGLQHRGYRLLAVLKDDRGPGIDTVYYGMEVRSFA